MIRTAQALLAVPGIDVNARDINGYSALILAASVGRTSIVQALLAVPGIDSKQLFALAYASHNASQLFPLREGSRQRR